MRRLLGMHQTPKPGRRIQDPFGLRAFPQVQGPALDAIHYLRDVLAIEINASTENPMISTVHGDAYHHAHFHTAYVSTALDQARATVHQVAELSVARLGDLVEPEFTGLRPFLAAGPAGSSGVMILEYVAHDALTELRQAALPATLGTAVVPAGAGMRAGRGGPRAADAGRGPGGPPGARRVRRGVRSPGRKHRRPPADRRHRPGDHGPGHPRPHLKRREGPLSGHKRR
jgi:histidine ammonia-lyase